MWQLRSAIWVMRKILLSVVTADLFWEKESTVRCVFQKIIKNVRQKFGGRMMCFIRQRTGLSAAVFLLLIIFPAGKVVDAHFKIIGKFNQL